MWIWTAKKSDMVTSLAEVWIETISLYLISGSNSVTSLAEVWIETGPVFDRDLCHLSLPLRKCGLKHLPILSKERGNRVTSLAEVWIETGATASGAKGETGHFPCGSVD